MAAGTRVVVEFAQMKAKKISLAALAIAAAAVFGFAWRIRAGMPPAATQPSTAPARAVSAKMLEEIMDKLRPLHTRLGPPRPGEWLYHHPEPGQSFAQYLRSRAVVPSVGRRVIYIQPLGTFTRAQRKIVDLAGDFLRRHYSLPGKLREGLPDSIVPASARRTHPSWGDKQILTSYVLDKLLLRRLPKDAFAYIAFTASDLWPGRGWNFVFGQASLRQRVGVWSIYRFGDPDKGGEHFRRCLRRTLSTAAHEIGHMCSMLHCTAYACNMCGSNSLPESDRRPLALCPECLVKLCWATKADPAERYRKLIEFCKTHGLKAEQAFYEKSLKALTAGRGHKE